MSMKVNVLECNCPGCNCPGCKCPGVQMSWSANVLKYKNLGVQNTNVLECKYSGMQMSWSANVLEYKYPVLLSDTCRENIFFRCIRYTFWSKPYGKKCTLHHKRGNWAIKYIIVNFVFSKKFLKQKIYSFCFIFDASGRNSYRREIEKFY